MDKKSRTTEALAAELALLHRKILDLVYLRQLVADKENAEDLKRDGASGRPLGEANLRNRTWPESSLRGSQKTSTRELPEKSRKFLESFLADKDPSTRRGGTSTRE